MSSTEANIYTTAVRMALTAFMTAYYAKQGYTAETRAAMRQAFAETAAIDLSFIPDKEARCEAIVAFGAAAARATEQRILDRFEAKK